VKTQMERRYPIAIDIGTQLDQSPCQFVFFYDDGGVFRAFAADSTMVRDETVTAYGSDNKEVVVIPKDTVWRLVNKNVLEFVTGAEMEEIEMTNYKKKHDLQKSLVESLGLEKEKEESQPASSGFKTEYELGYNPKLYP
jgi:hypothetical protein